MAALSLPNDFVNGQVADASPVDENYDLIESYINNHVIRDDGFVAMQQPLRLAAGDPTAPEHAANKDYVDNVLPIGTMMPWPGMAAPAGSSGSTVWLLCDGRSLSQTAYVELFGVVGLGYGTAVAGEFRLPNLAGRVMVGLNTAKTDFNTLGKQGGVYAAPLLQHNHTMAHDHGSFNSSDNLSNHVHSINHDHAVSSTGTSTDTHAHDLPLGLNSTPGSVLRPMAGSSTGTVSTTANTGVDSDTHIHSINLPNYVGNSGANSGNHTHSINVPPYTAAMGNTSNTGVAAVEHLPPYVTINFIIKAL